MNPQIRNMPENFGGGLWKDVTNIHPIGVLALLVLGLAMLFVTRRRAIMPMLIIACFISSVQKIVIFNLDFNFLRIMVVFGILRLIIKGEYKLFVLKSVDKALILWAICSICIYTLRVGTASALINRIGFAFDVFGMYFVFRCLIQNWQDADQIISGCIWISIPVAMAFIYELFTGHNIFSVFGGIPEITYVREGRLRCQGAFSHAILAGCFWASLMPLFVSRWWMTAEDKIFAAVGLMTSMIIVFCSASSTPVMGVIAGLIGGLCFFLRRKMRIIRWGILLTLIALHMVMNAPVWHLVSRVSAVGGSTSYFRYMLINGAIHHFDEWALLGTDSTAHWFWGAQDICNQYVMEGVSGGFLTLCLFVIVIALAFREIGKLWHLNERNPQRMALCWAMGVSLFVHCTNFIGVSYFGQIWILWYLLLAMIGSLSIRVPSPSVSKIRPSKTHNQIQTGQSYGAVYGIS